MKHGLGDAYLHAFAIGLREGYDALVEIDADLSHDPADLPMMLDLADRGIALVIGSRYIPGGSVIGWPRRRTWLSRWGNRYAGLVLGLALNDATSGYRVYRADTLRTIGIDGVQADGYGFQVEMTYRVVQAGLSVVEVPIAFRDRVAGASKMHRGIVIEAFKLVTLLGIARHGHPAPRPPHLPLATEQARRSTHLNQPSAAGRARRVNRVGCRARAGCDHGMHRQRHCDARPTVWYPLVMMEP